MELLLLKPVCIKYYYLSHFGPHISQIYVGIIHTK